MACHQPQLDLPGTTRLMRNAQKAHHVQHLLPPVDETMADSMREVHSNTAMVNGG